MSEIKEGQEVILKAIGNNARYDKKEHYIKGIVEKVGRKLVEVKQEGGYFSIKIRIENRRENSEFPGWQLYLSQQEIEDEFESAAAAREIRKVIGQYGPINLSLDKLRRILQILKEV